MSSKFVIYLDKSKHHRFRLLAPNGEIIAQGEAYNSKAACLHGIKSIQKNAPIALIVDETVKKEAVKKDPVKKPVTKKTTAKKPAAKKPAAKKPADKKPVAPAPAAAPQAVPGQ